jgi:hypothetical protein
MKCELAQEKIALAVFGELPDEASPELNQHLAVCEDCRRELEAVKALQQAMYLYPVAEPSANSLARARLKLEDALDNLPTQNWFVRSLQNLLAGAGRLRTAPVAASALLVLGLGAGTLGGYRFAQSKSPAALAAIPAIPATVAVTSDIPTGNAQIANVSSIVREPNSETVEVTYDRIVPQKVRGSLDDPAIRHLLLLGTQTNDDNGIRTNSIDLLASECLAGHECTGGPVRNALMTAARYDASPAVRKKALAGLQPYVAEDTRVRDGILEILMHDDDVDVRLQAISVVRPVETDSSVREVLHTVASRDRNPHIRYASQQMLSQLPEVQ